MKTITHNYEKIKHRTINVEKIGCELITTKEMTKVVGTFVIKERDLQEIAEILIKRYINKVKTTTEVSNNAGGKKIIITENIEKMRIPVTDIDELVEQYYPDISEIPSAKSKKVKSSDENVWLNASYEVEKELRRLGFEVYY